MRTYIVRDHHIIVATKRPAKYQKGDLVIASPQDLTAARLPAKRLIAIWNALPGVKRVTKITDRAAMLERLWAALEALPAEPIADRAAPRASKQGQVIEMLRRQEGATLEEIAAATGWQRHTVRGAIAGAIKKKLALPVTVAKEERGRVYRLPAGA